MVEKKDGWMDASSSERHLNGLHLPIEEGFEGVDETIHSGLQQ